MRTVKLRTTKGDLKNNAKQASIELLRARVADTIGLALITEPIGI